MRVLRAVTAAFAAYSRIPVPLADDPREGQELAMCFFPLVGAAVGLAMAAWLLLCDVLGLGGLLRGAIGALIPLLVTGGIHMDGFMDTCDALASWQSKERRLEILKDSHVGAFAVMGCCGMLLAAAGLLSEASSRDALPLVACFIASRALSACTSAALRSARPDGMLARFVRPAHKRAVCAGGAIYLAASVIVWLLCGGAQMALLCGAAAALCTLAYRRMAYRQFGGVTGDLAGWFLQVTELCCIAAVIMGGKLA